MIRVGVIGAGYWGPNLIRNFQQCPTTELVAVADLDEKRLEKLQPLYPHVTMLDSPDQLYGTDKVEVDAVAIATPVSTHKPLSLEAFSAGKHVLIEKPLAASVDDAQQMLDAATQANCKLMVDHTFVFSPAVQKIKQLIDAGDIGELYYIDGVRINLGLFQSDVNVLWDLAPHDLSIVDHILGRLPRSLSAFGACHGIHGIEDVAYLNMDFGHDLLASFHVNWLSPVKVRQFLIGGSKKGIVYNDLESAEKIKVYDRSVSINKSAESRRDLLIDYRTGDVWSPHLATSEPLQQVVRHFAHCIEHNEQPITSGESGMRVVQILAAAQRSIKAQGGRITL